MEEQKQGVKETLETLAGLETLVVSGKKIFADGKVNLADLPEFLAIAQKSDILVAAVEGADQIPKEIGDLSEAEAALVMAATFSLVRAIKAKQA